jgi:catalase (peroxidase I)
MKAAQNPRRKAVSPPTVTGGQSNCVDLLNQHSNRSNPLGESFNYREEFKNSTTPR